MLTNNLFGDQTLKIRETVMALKAAADKMPAKKDEIFVKGVTKF